MGLMQIVISDTDHTIQLPKEFVDRLGVHDGQKLTIQLVKDAEMLLLFPSRLARRHRRRPRYDEIYDSARELEALTAPFTSAHIQPEAIQALQRMPTDE